MAHEIQYKDINQADIIGDVHACYEPMIGILNQLGYWINPDNRVYRKDNRNRKIIFVGDLCDRGPKPIEVLKLIMAGSAQGIIFSVLGNHDDKLLRALKGNNIKHNEEIDETINAIEKEGKAFKNQVMEFLENLPYQIYLKPLNTIVVHASVKTKKQAIDQGKFRAYSLYGHTTGQSDAEGRPIRLNWQEHYKGEEMIIYGHTIVQDLTWINRTLDLDLGCYQTNKLGAVRLPEKDFVLYEHLKES